MQEFSYYHTHKTKIFPYIIKYPATRLLFHTKNTYQTINYKFRISLNLALFDRDVVYVVFSRQDLFFAYNLLPSNDFKQIFKSHI